jgi:hypothetical protein
MSFNNYGDRLRDSLIHSPDNGIDNRVAIKESRSLSP